MLGTETHMVKAFIHLIVHLTDIQRYICEGNQPSEAARGAILFYIRRCLVPRNNHQLRNAWLSLYRKADVVSLEST